MSDATGQHDLPLATVADPIVATRAGDEVSTLHYAAAHPPRPLIVTVVALVSLLLGVVGVITNGTEVISGTLAWHYSRTSVAPTPPAPTVTPVPNPARFLRTMDDVIDTLDAAEPVSSSRRQMLRRLLLRLGPPFMYPASFATTQPAPLPHVVRAVVAEGGPTTYDLVGGQLIVDDAYVSWRPGTDFRAHPLTDEEVEQVVRLYSWYVTFTPPELDALRSALRWVGQHVVDPVTPGQLPGRIPVYRGTDTIDVMSRGRLMIPRNPPAPPPALPAPPPPPKPAAGALPVRTRVDPYDPAGDFPPRAGIVVNAVGAGLAAYLLVAGGLVLRMSKSARTHHRAWACAKIATVLLVLAAWGVFTSGRTRFANSFGFATVWTMMNVVGAIAYPVAVLWVMRLREVREYYERPEARV